MKGNSGLRGRTIFCDAPAMKTSCHSTWGLRQATVLKPLLALIVSTSIPLFAGLDDWNPAPNPTAATAGVSLRRIQNLQVKPGETFKWTFGTAQGEGKADAGGLITIPGLKITAEPTSLTVTH